MIAALFDWVALLGVFFIFGYTMTLIFSGHFGRRHAPIWFITMCTVAVCTFVAVTT